MHATSLSVSHCFGVEQSTRSRENLRQIYRSATFSEHDARREISSSRGNVRSGVVKGYSLGDV